jgi:uncharacterized protein
MRLHFVLGMLLLCAACAAPQQQLNVAELRGKAESGDMTAAVAMGLLYDSGTEVPKNQVEAVRWYRIAADQGHAEAQNSLGSMYQAGEGVPRDYSEAMRWYSIAADRGHAEALNNLAYLYDLGLGVPEDNPRAADLYSKAAEKGSVKAMLNLGLMLGQGEKEVERDVVRAFMWLDLGRFYTQFSRDMRLKWRVRGALDELKKQMTPQQIARGEQLTREWDGAHRKK